MTQTPDQTPGVTPYVRYTGAPPVNTAPALPKVDGLAVASLVLGICWLYWIGSVLAIIFAAIAIKRINESQGWRTGKGMAIAGLVLGLVGAATFVIMILAVAGSGGS